MPKVKVGGGRIESGLHTQRPVQSELLDKFRFDEQLAAAAFGDLQVFFDMFFDIHVCCFSLQVPSTCRKPCGWPACCRLRVTLRGRIC